MPQWGFILSVVGYVVMWGRHEPGFIVVVCTFCGDGRWLVLYSLILKSAQRERALLIGPPTLPMLPTRRLGLSLRLCLHNLRDVCYVCRVTIDSATSAIYAIYAIPTTSATSAMSAIPRNVRKFAITSASTTSATSALFAGLLKPLQRPSPPPTIYAIATTLRNAISTTS